MVVVMVVVVHILAAAGAEQLADGPSQEARLVLAGVVLRLEQGLGALLRRARALRGG